jgi:hypothetical protein
MRAAAASRARRCSSSGSSGAAPPTRAAAAAATAVRQSLLRRRRPSRAAAAPPPRASSSSPPPSDAPPLPPLPRIVFPPSTVVSKADGYDLRLYQPYPVVRTDYTARPPAFLALGEYLGGANAAGARFAFPEPAIMRQGLAGGRKTMELYVGVRRGEAGASAAAGDSGGGGSGSAPPPAPDDPALSLDVSGGELVAAARFGGNLTREAAEAAHAALRAALSRDGLAAADDAGVYRACQYGAIHSLGERLNEIWVRVKL